MKRTICFILSLIFVITALVMPASASTYFIDSTSTIQHNHGFSIETQSFVPGETIVRIFDFRLSEDDNDESHVQSIRGISSYINVPFTTDKVEAYLILDDFFANNASLLDCSNSLTYPNAVLLRTASPKYNCHSYAWYSTDSDNSYWIDDPYYFRANSSEYGEVLFPAVGDIVCYYDDGGNNLHSGIVTGMTGQESNGLCGDSNTVEVTSKWGFHGLYRHNGYECPYTSYAGGSATCVRYFRKHTHSLVYRNITTYYEHRVSCTTCNFTYTEPHTWKKIRVDLMGCLYCNAITDGPVLLDSVPEDVMTSMDNVLGVGGDGAITYDDGLVLCRIDGDYYLVVGVTTEEAVSHVRNQLTYVRNPEI